MYRGPRQHKTGRRTESFYCELAEERVVFMSLLELPGMVLTIRIMTIEFKERPER